jgi:hypothetical protein
VMDDNVPGLELHPVEVCPPGGLWSNGINIPPRTGGDPGAY